VRSRLPFAILLTALAFLTTPSGSAAYTEFGNHCTGNATEKGWTALGLANGEEPPFPGSAGPSESWKPLSKPPNAVITRWKVQVGSGLGPLSQQLVAFNYASEDETRNLGESAVEVLVEGSNEFTSRIPIPEYAHIGLRGPSEALYCDGTAMGALGAVTGDFAVGTASRYELLFPRGVPVIAIAEPDLDGDGYGDETQDICPLSPQFHDSCPSVTLDVRLEAIRPGAVLIAAMTNIDTRVEVRGQITWTDPRHRRRGRTISLGGGVQQLAPGMPVVFRVPLPKAVVKKLHRMTPRERLKANMTIARLDRLEELMGTVTTSLFVRLPGRERRPSQR
jgi:hypothetical protein